MGDKYYIFKPALGRVEYIVQARELPATQYELDKLAKSSGQFVAMCPDMQSLRSFMRANVGEDCVLNRVN